MPRRYVDRASALRSVANKPVPASDWRPNFRDHGTTIPHSWILDYHADCTDPVHIFRDGVRLTKGANQHLFGPLPLERPVMTEIIATCRKCDNCLRRRAAHWRLRAYAEYSNANRTWFGSLTLSPEQHFRVATACRAYAIKNGDDFDTFSPERQFLLRHQCINKEITLYLKRLRKHAGDDSIRFMCVLEAHKSGLPHYHMLVHESDPQKPIRHALLSEQWRVGFSNWKLVTTKAAAGYVTKYLSKAIMARVRASIAYGNNTSSDIGLLKKSVKTNDPIRAAVPLGLTR